MPKQSRPRHFFGRSARAAAKRSTRALIGGSFSDAGTQSITPDVGAKPASKFNARRVTLDGKTFHSKKEAKRYLYLKARQDAGEIATLECQVPFVFALNGVKICTYFADFRYFDLKASKCIVEDVKGFRTDVYRIKKKMVSAFYPGVVVVEV